MSDWIDLAIKVYDESKEHGLIEWVKSFFRSNKTILVLGASGAGKTQFINSMVDPQSYPVGGYQRTIMVKRKKMQMEKHPFVLIDTPGQKLDEAKRKQGIRDALSKGVEGIINVVCHGYHEASEADSQDAIPQSGGRIAKADYLDVRRKVELDLLSEWVPFIGTESTRWIMTLVTKADLWWPEEEAVKHYYEQGAYAKALGSLKDINHVLPICSVIHLFYGTKTSGKFDDEKRNGLRGNLLETLRHLTRIAK